VKRYWAPALFLFWVVCISGIFGNVGIIQAVKLRNARAELQEKLLTLKVERDRLVQILSRVEKDRITQESVVRDTLGFVKDGELVFEWGS